MRVSAIEGHRVWASSYDAGLNPLLALEARLVLERLVPIGGSLFLDVACGTGRWMLMARQCGAQVLGFDFCREMLYEASRKPGLAGRLSLADACRVPVASGVSDLTLCSFALGYVASPRQTIAEMARVTRRGARIIATDLHPAAIAAGWTRSFRAEGRVYEIEHHLHPIRFWEAAAESAGLLLDWRIDAGFGEPEREVFRQAGKDSAFDEMSRVPAVLAMCWTKS
jgi:ubiquinone/menaquinone biosynthesis C-methylase UbiE